MRIPSPLSIKHQLPVPKDAVAFIHKAREEAKAIIHRKTEKLALLVGPCSIHDPKMALEYADRLQKLSSEMGNFFLVMRVFLEKPRTRVGWKGLLYDPHLDGSNDLITGIQTSRSLLIEIATRGVPIATEILEPLALPYLQDLITWGLVGARTSASQPHRQIASGLSFPVGFKNDIHGEIDVAICGILTARLPHSFLHIDEEGHIASAETAGNPHTHLVLRGSETKTNFDRQSIAIGLSALATNHLEPSLLIDCSHGNSGKDHKKQVEVFHTVLDQVAEGNRAIAGLMLESHLMPGKQTLRDRPADLLYGVSITDSCIGWEETEGIIRSADEALSKVMSSVHK